MTLRTIDTARLVPGGAGGGTKQLPVNTDSQAVVIKALKGNEADVEIGPKTDLEAETGYPLEKGEKLSLEMKGISQLWLKTTKEKDGIAILTLAV